MIIMLLSSLYFYFKVFFVRKVMCLVFQISHFIRVRVLIEWNYVIDIFFSMEKKKVLL